MGGVDSKPVNLVPGWYRQPMPLPSSITRLADEIRGRVGDWIERNPEGAARVVLWMEEQMERSEDPGAPVDLAQSFMQALVPRNWWPLGIGLHGRARKVMAESGICLIWVPPAEIVQAVAHAESKKDRDEVLVANTARILDAVDEALAEAEHPRLGVTVAAAREALEAQRSGFTKPAQALTASVLSEVVQEHFGFDKFGYARQAFESEPSSAAGLWSSRRTAVQEAIHVAIMRSNDRPPEAGFNRHLSAHGVDPRQFCEPHGLEGLMLLAGAIRELQEIYRVAERGFGPSPRLSEFAVAELHRRMEAAQRTQEQGAIRERAPLN